MEEKRRNQNNIIILFLAVVPYLVPAGLGSLPIFDLLYKLKYVSIITIVLIAFKKRVKLNMLVVNLLLFTGSMICITIMLDSNMLESFKRMTDIVVPVLWMNLMLKLNARRTLKFLIIYFGMLAVVNLIVIILLPNGLTATMDVNKMYLISVDNKMIFTLLPMLGIALFYIEMYQYRYKFAYNLYAIIVFASAVFVIWNATGVVVVASMLLCWICDKYELWISKFFTIRNGIIFLIIVIYLAVISDVFQTGILGMFITEVLHKPVTFSGRKTLWVQALQLIEKSPFLGYGVDSEILSSFSFSTSAGLLTGFSSHNGFLRILLEGGILTLALYFNIFVGIHRSCRTILKKYESVRILSYSMLAFLLACIFEAEFYSTTFMFLIALLYYTPKLLNQSQQLV